MACYAHDGCRLSLVVRSHVRGEIAPQAAAGIRVGYAHKASCKGLTFNADNWLSSRLSLRRISCSCWRAGDSLFRIPIRILLSQGGTPHRMAYFGPHLTRESRVLVMGLPRYGKTTLVRRKLTSGAPRVIWHDVTGHDYTGPGRIACSISTLESNKQWLDEDFARIVVKAQSAGDPDVIKDEVLRIIRLVSQVGDIVVVFDEVQSHERKTEKALNGLFARGNHYGIVPIACSQRATDIPLGSRVNASDVYCFGQHHPKELRALFDCYGDLYADACNRARKGAPPVHWQAERREQWWTKNARHSATR